MGISLAGLEAVNGEVGWYKTKTREEKGGKFDISKKLRTDQLIANTQQRTAISRQPIFSLLPPFCCLKVLNWICNFRQAYEAIDMMSWSACALQANIDAIPKATGGGTREQQQHSHGVHRQIWRQQIPHEIFMSYSYVLPRTFNTRCAFFFRCFGVWLLYAFCSTHSTTLFAGTLCIVENQQSSFYFIYFNLFQSCNGREREKKEWTMASRWLLYVQYTRWKMSRVITISEREITLLTFKVFN